MCFQLNISGGGCNLVQERFGSWNSELCIMSFKTRHFTSNSFPPVNILASVWKKRNLCLRRNLGQAQNHLHRMLTYRVALNFCGSLILQIGDFFCFAGTIFCDWKRLVSLAGN